MYVCMYIHTWGRARGQGRGEVAVSVPLGTGRNAVLLTDTQVTAKPVLHPRLAALCREYKHVRISAMVSVKRCYRCFFKLHAFANVLFGI